ncbi:McrC family protein [Zavarzinella formosa]|uniref:McrC family protein n=1 Tax=Zavarzinella formosa TaxID=360055 RepID=UPI0002ED5D64|nr:hypothetical protein [Zavarzinella formosa]
MNQPQIIRVTEDRSVEAELSPEAVTELIGLPNSLFEFRPMITPGKFRIIAGGRIGVWESPSLKVLVEPKIRDVNLLAMIDPDSPIHSHGAEPEHRPEESFLGLLAVRLGRLMVAHARRGLRQGYSAISEESAFLRGKLDIPAQLREHHPAASAFHIEHDCLTRDILVNQIPKALAAQIADRFSASTEAGGCLSDAITSYAGVSAEGLDLRRAFDELDRASPDASEKELIDLARLIWEGFDPRETSDKHHTSLQMLDLHLVFERYVADGLMRSLREFDVQSQRSIVIAEASHRPAELTARPDVLITNAGQPWLVLDTKWKTFVGAPAADDLQQIIAYLHVTKSPFGMLVYPGTRHDFNEFAINGGGVLILQQIQVTGTCGECRDSLNRLAHEIHRRIKTDSPPGRE